jgi:hypothetical protein
MTVTAYFSIRGFESPRSIFSRSKIKSSRASWEMLNSKKPQRLSISPLLSNRRWWLRCYRAI